MAFIIQVTENVISYQMTKYAKKKGIDMEEPEPSAEATKAPGIASPHFGDEHDRV